MAEGTTKNGDMLAFFQNLDRRWIFLMMFLSVAIPIYFGWQFPEKATGLAESTFDQIEMLAREYEVVDGEIVYETDEEGDFVWDQDVVTGRRAVRLLLAYDFDPGSEGELLPMATAFTRHACEMNRATNGNVKLYFMALWPLGVQMIEDQIRNVVRADFGDMVYGEDYVNLGFKAGNEGVIKVVVTDIRQLYTTDHLGTAVDEIPMMAGITSIQQMDLIMNCSAGYPGTKEWIQYAVTPFPEKIRMVAGCTGVQAPLLYPYIPDQLPGLLGAIKGASEYEALVLERYGRRDAEGNLDTPGRYLEGRRRMGPQFVAHLLMIGLIIAGNVIYFLERKRGGR